MANDLRMVAEAGDDSTTGWEMFIGVLRRVWDWVSDPTRKEQNMLSYEYLLHELRTGAPEPDYVVERVPMS